MKRAILVFLKYPTPGTVKTRLAAEIGKKEATKAYEQLVCRVLEQCRMANPDILAIAYDPPERGDEIHDWLEPWLKAFPGRIEWIPQSEGDLGDRLDGATTYLFKRTGIAAVAVIGTDCVHLGCETFEKCWTALEEGSDAVFGPTEDGGYYLVGLRKPQPVLFRNIPWSAEDTLQASLVAAIFGESHDRSPPGSIRCRYGQRMEQSRVGGHWSTMHFLRRDGVVNRSPGPGYVLSVGEFELNPGIAESLRWLKDRNFLAILATSQRGVGKGLMTQDDLDEIHRHMQTELKKGGAAFDGIYAYTETSDCRLPPKPEPGMILSAIESFSIDPRQSWMIGDADRDIQMGISAGLAGTIRVKSENKIGVEADHTLKNTIEIPDILEKIL